jgi:hypothetical protein
MEATFSMIPGNIMRLDIVILIILIILLILIIINIIVIVELFACLYSINIFSCCSRNAYDYVHMLSLHLYSLLCILFTFGL